jgi:hypothetical protein
MLHENLPNTPPRYQQMLPNYPHLSSPHASKPTQPVCGRGGSDSRVDVASPPVSRTDSKPPQQPPAPKCGVVPRSGATARPSVLRREPPRRRHPPLGFRSQIITTTTPNDRGNGGGGGPANMSKKKIEVKKKKRKKKNSPLKFDNRPGRKKRHAVRRKYGVSVRSSPGVVRGAPGAPSGPPGLPLRRDGRATPGTESEVHLEEGRGDRRRVPRATVRPALPDQQIPTPNARSRRCAWVHNSSSSLSLLSSTLSPFLRPPPSRETQGSA